MVSAFTLAKPEGPPGSHMSNGEKLARLVVRMVLALPRRSPAGDENETPEEREQRRTREFRELHEHVQGRLARFASGDWLALLEEARDAWPVRRLADGAGEETRGKSQRRSSEQLD